MWFVDSACVSNIYVYITNSVDSSLVRQGKSRGTLCPRISIWKYCTTTTVTVAVAGKVNDKM